MKGIDVKTENILNGKPVYLLRIANLIAWTFDHNKESYGDWTTLGKTDETEITETQRVLLKQAEETLKNL